MGSNAESSTERPLAGLSMALVGPGRVGSSLASWAVAAGARVDAVAGRTAEGAAAVAAELGAEAVAGPELDSSGADLVLIAVPDPALGGVARDLARRRQAAVGLHTAGSRGASALAPLRTAGAAVGSLHPLKAFPRSLPDPAEARGTLFAVDGDPAALRAAGRLAAAFGGSVAEVPEDLRPLYHLAASVAAGGVVTLVASAADLARSLGLSDTVARGYLDLARGALAAAHRQVGAPHARSTGRDPDGRQRTTAAAETLAGAITGPVARGDTDLVTRQLESLEARSAAEAGGSGPRTGEARLELFAHLALETARLSLGAARAEELRRAFEAAGWVAARSGSFLDSAPGGC